MRCLGTSCLLRSLRAVTIGHHLFSGLPVTVTGHTQDHGKTLRHEEAPHIFSLKKRSRCGFADEEVESSFVDEPHPDDIILCVKLHLSSATLAQPPLVFCPARHFIDLDLSKLVQTPRHAFSDVQIKEFRRTATVIRARPWCLDDGAICLEELVNNNVAGSASCWVPPCIVWVCTPTRAINVSQSMLVSSTELSFAARQPSGVHVLPRPPKPTKKRPAAAATLTCDGMAGAPPVLVEPGAPHGSGVRPRQRRPAGPLPELPPPYTYGCPKCRMSPSGCTYCRSRLGVSFDEEAQTWTLDLERLRARPPRA